ncbi:hypothetical protein [Vibrio phage VP16T]|nr:hypothetical protein [Vibrio phage VP16T]
MADRHILYKLRAAIAGQFVADGSEVEIDDSALANVTADSAQDVAAELNRLFTQVQNTVIPQQGRALNTFSGAVTVTSANFADYQNRNSVYVASVDQRVTFLLPSEADIPAGQYPVTIEISHFGGTARFEDGAAPTNTIVIDSQGSDVLQNAVGSVLAFAELHRGDTGVITKQAAGQPWVVRESQTDPRTSLLPSGVFNLRPEVVTLSGPTITGLGLTTPVKGYAYEVQVGNDNFGLTGVEAGDVIVAKQDGPNLATVNTNDDWLIIRDLQNFALTAAEIRLLAQWSENTETVTGPALTNTRFWLTDTVPASINDLLLPDAQSDQYNGDTSLADKVLTIAVPVGSADATKLVLRDLNLAGVSDDALFMGNFVERTDLGVNSGRTYYMLGTNLTTASPYRYTAGHTLTAHSATQQREYTPSAQVDTTSSVKDLPLSALEPNVRSLLVHGTGLEAPGNAVLNGFTTTFTTADYDENTVNLVVYGELDRDLANATFTSGNKILPTFAESKVQLLAPQGATITSVRQVSNHGVTAQVVRIGDIDVGFSVALTHYEVTLPAVAAGQTVAGSAFEVVGSIRTYTLDGAGAGFKINRSNLSDSLNAYIQSLVPANPSGAALPDGLDQFNRHLTAKSDESSTWSRIQPSPIRATLTQQFAAFWGENRNTYGDNSYFENGADVEVFGYDLGRVYYYADSADANNSLFPGVQSYVYEDNVRVRNRSGKTQITSNYQKIIAFDYALEAPLGSGDNFDMLRLGAAGATPLIGISEAEGLYLNIGRGDGGVQTRTVNQFFQVDNSQWHSRVGQTVNDQAEVLIPDQLSGALAVTLSVHGWNNDNDGGVQTFVFNIANVGADQGQTAHTFSGYSNGAGDLAVNISYQHANMDTGSARRIVLITTSSPLDNAAMRWDIQAFSAVTETWNAPTSYARQPINAGSGTDDHGFYDPHNFTTERVHERNQVMVALVKANPNDVSTSPELAALVIVDGQAENNGQPIALGRHSGEFTFDDQNFGNGAASVGHIQCYDYSGPEPTAIELTRLYNARANWLDAFYPPGHAVETFTIDAHVSLTQGHGFEVRAPNGAVYRIAVDNTGSLSTIEV